MRKEDFTSSAAMTVRRQPNGLWTACPNPLPPVINPSWTLFQSLSEADRAISELAGVARTLPNPHLLITPFMRKEAVLSSRIEGTQATLSDLFLFEAAGQSRQMPVDVREVFAYVTALSFALDEIKRMPLSIRLIRMIHEMLMTDPTKTPGEIRKSQNWIGPPGSSLSEASYVPPAPDAVLDHLSDLEKYLHVRGNLPPLVKYAIVHYQFESIHPFLDGNGRLGRLLITLLLCADPTLDIPLLPQPLLYLSAYFENNRTAYYEALDGVSKHGQWEKWIAFFLQGVASQSRDAVQRSDQLLDLKQNFLKRVHDARGSSTVHEIVEQLFITPVVTVADLARQLKRTYPAANSALARLAELGLVRELKGTPQRAFAAWEIIRAVDE